MKDMQISSYYNNHLAVEYPWVVQERVQEAAMKQVMMYSCHCTVTARIQSKEIWWGRQPHLQISMVSSLFPNVNTGIALIVENSYVSTTCI